MKIHPEGKHPSITLRYDIASALAQANSLLCHQKSLRRLPHIFAKVLELPFRSDADVWIQEKSDSLRFSVVADEIGDDVRAHAIEIHPGVTKVVVRGSDALDYTIDELEMDLWRFRLPASTRPEMATAAYGDGELVVTVPKGVNSGDEDDDGGDGIGVGAGLMLLVQ